MARAYIKRLTRELPEWRDRGWIAPDGEQAILDHVAEPAGGDQRAPVAVAVLGVIILGIGVILFFAANWTGLTKVTKLVALFGGMWLAYGAAAYSMRRAKRPTDGFSQALLLLGVVLFGAGIMLVAQIYHYESHYPNSVLLWSSGALVLAYLVPAQTVVGVGLLLATLWSGLEIVEYHRTFHGEYFLLWAAFLPAVYLGRFRIAAGIALFGVLVWATLSFVGWVVLSFSGGALSQALYLTEIYATASIAVFLVGVAMERSDRLRCFAALVQRFAILGSLVGAYMLILRANHGLLSAGFIRSKHGPPSIEWAIGIGVALLAVVALGAWLHRRRPESGQPGIWLCGQILFAGFTAAIVASMVLATGLNSRVAVYVLFNIVFFVGLVWLVYSGYRQHDYFRINSGYVLIVIGLLTLYFDTLWSLMTRSYFFAVGGALLLGCGFLLDRERRRLSGRVEDGPAREGES